MRELFVVNRRAHATLSENKSERDRVRPRAFLTCTIVSTNQTRIPRPVGCVRYFREMNLTNCRFILVWSVHVSSCSILRVQRSLRLYYARACAADKRLSYALSAIQHERRFSNFTFVDGRAYIVGRTASVARA